MNKGTVEWFNNKKGYGFIIPEEQANNDIFFHISLLQKLGITKINEGQAVIYDTYQDRNRTAAQIIEIIT